jgi:hypothetical protein
MTDIAIRVENYILSRVEGCILSTSTALSVDSVEGLSKLYPSTLLRACPECNEGAGHIGRA